MTNRKQTPTTTSSKEAPFPEHPGDGVAPRKRRAQTRKVRHADGLRKQRTEPKPRGLTVDLDGVICRALRKYTTSGLVFEVTGDKRLPKFLYGFLHDVHPIPAGDRFFMVHVTP